MATEKGNFIAVAAGKRPKSLLIMASGIIIHCHHPLIKTQARRTVARWLTHFATIKPCIATVQQPALRLANGNPRMPQRMTRQRDQQDVWQQSFKRDRSYTVDELNRTIDRLCRENNINIAFNQLEVHLRNASGDEHTEVKRELKGDDPTPAQS